MASIQSVAIGFVIFVTCIATSWLLAYTGGSTIDRVYNESQEYVLDHPSVDTTAFYQETKNLALGPINLFYLLIYGLPIIGLVILYQSVVRYQGQDTLMAGSYGNARARRRGR